MMGASVPVPVFEMIRHMVSSYYIIVNNVQVLKNLKPIKKNKTLIGSTVFFFFGLWQER